MSTILCSSPHFMLLHGKVVTMGGHSLILHARRVASATVKSARSAPDLDGLELTEKVASNQLGNWEQIQQGRMQSDEVPGGHQTVFRLHKQLCPRRLVSLEPSPAPRSIAPTCVGSRHFVYL